MGMSQRNDVMYKACYPFYLTLMSLIICGSRIAKFVRVTEETVKGYIGIVKIQQTYQRI
jgi:hypothetical protein